MTTSTTTNYGWTIPNDDELVKNGALAIRTLGNAIDTSLGGTILQVVSTTKTDTFTTTSTSYTDITGLSVSITPSSTSSKILLIASVEGATTQGTSNSTAAIQVVRDSTPIGIATSVGSRTAATSAISTRLSGSNVITIGQTKTILDSPSTTSSTTYKLQGLVGAGTLFINRFELDTDSADFKRTVSTLTAIEVAG